MSERPEVTVVGAGVAGMSAALRLLQAGFKVHLIEKADHPGGQFDAVRHQRPDGDHYHEHSYHFFADWCVNFWDIVSDIGLPSSQFEKRPAYKFLRRKSTRGAPQYTQLENTSSPLWFWKNIDSEVKPWHEMLIYSYSSLDLLSQDLDWSDNEAFLNTISVNGFMFSRRYATEESAKLHQEVLLKTFSIPSYRTSARTYRTFLKYTSAYPVPTFVVLKGNSQQLFCDLFLKKLFSFNRQKHATEQRFRYSGETSLIAIAIASANKSVTAVTVRKSGQEQQTLPVDQLILAIPFDQLWHVIKSNQALFELAPELFNIRKLNNQAMASLSIHFKQRLPGIPREHVTLLDSEYALSFIDNSQLWNEYRHSKHTVLNVVSANFQALEGLSEQAAKREIVRELAEYLDIAGNDIDLDNNVYLRSNTEAPLFLNEVGSWENRPEIRPAEEYSAHTLDRDPPISEKVHNLYLAGDYCRNKIDVVSIESAVYTGLLAARLLSQNNKTAATQLAARPKRPKEYSREVYLKAKTELQSWLGIADEVADIDRAR